MNTIDLHKKIKNYYALYYIKYVTPNNKIYNIFTRFPLILFNNENSFLISRYKISYYDNLEEMLYDISIKTDLLYNLIIPVDWVLLIKAISTVNSNQFEIVYSRV